MSRDLAMISCSSLARHHLRLYFEKRQNFTWDSESHCRIIYADHAIFKMAVLDEYDSMDSDDDLNVDIRPSKSLIKARRRDRAIDSIAEVSEAAPSQAGSLSQSFKSQESEESDEGWTNQGKATFERLNKKKSTTRKRAAAGSRSTRAKRVKRGNDETGHGDEEGDPKKTSRKKKAKDYGDDPTDDDEDLMEWTLPDYVQERRRVFDERAQRLRTGGLNLPPTWDDVDFSDNDRIHDLREKPDLKHLKPCAAYKDIPLAYSLGLIPAPIARWLRDYQVKGVAFLHEMFVYQKGGILGDDMGLGKTIQVIAFLTAAYGKTGDERDDKRLRKTRRVAGKWYPRTLIICPGTLMENWMEELKRWGWWHCDKFHHTGDRDGVIEAAQAGFLEIVITTYATYKNHEDQINEVAWDCVVADEFHSMKHRRGATAKSMNNINALCRIGLSGTAIQNNYEELWTLLNWTNPGRFGPVSTWKTSICVPLKLGQSHDASIYQLALARKTARKLVENLLPQFFLRRMKSLIKDQLPKKTDRVVFCPMTETQTEAYENFVASDLVEKIRYSNENCDCESGKKSGWCCHTHLANGSKWQAGVFPALTTLQKLSNHLALLIPQSTDTDDKKTIKPLDLLGMAMPDKYEQLYAERDQIKHMANPAFCGKWRVLKKLMKFWHEERDANNKVLVFSHSVRLLKMLQSLFIHTEYNVKYLDGSMSLDERADAVRDFNTDPTQFVFLISTKAGGVGLNITSANKVVVVDPNWNPSYDLQAQDRAYRIGQTRDVEVFRLVSQGTLEEIIYARQIYKQQQASIGYSASTERRYFQGVQDNKDQKGELFGLANLFMAPSERLDTGGGVLKEIVNKTNVAESRADVRVVDIEIDEKSDIGSDSEDKVKIKKEDEDAALSQLAAEIIGEAPSRRRKPKASGDIAQPSDKKHDPVSAILASAGVQYTHENSEVVGSSKVEAHLSKQAEDITAMGPINGQDQRVFFEETQSQAKANELSGVNMNGGIRYKYRPPPDVQRRQFCSMAKHAGYEDMVEFALVVESRTQSERREFLSGFYRARRAMLLGLASGGDLAVKDEDETMVKVEDPTAMDGVLKLEDNVIITGETKTEVLPDDDEDDEL